MISGDRRRILLPPEIPMFVVAGGGFAGLLLAHAIGYLVAVPHRGHRHSLLASSGHGYLPVVLPFAVGAGILALLLAAILGWRRGSGRCSQTVDLRATALRLFGFQTLGFLLIEVLERLTARAHFDGFVYLLAAGLLAQAVIAVIFATLLELTGRAVARLAGILRIHPRRLTKVRPYSGPAIQERGAAHWHPVRGPPAIAPASK